MIIAQLGLSPNALHGETVVVTGGGSGIGYEAARALLWLGANVVIAEIDEPAGRRAAATLATEFDPRRVLFTHTDVGDQTSVAELREQAARRYGTVDVVINNATVAFLGEVEDVAIEDWDRSYRVNLRGPVLMAKTFLPSMIERRQGVFVCVSSTGTAFLGAYETLKAAQVHLANTLDAELEGTGVFAFTIGPGLVKTETASRAVTELAPKLGMTVEEFFEVNKGAVVPVEDAGAGFAASVLLAERFHGQEVSSMQALRAADVSFGVTEPASLSTAMDDQTRDRARVLCQAVRTTLAEQAEGWRSRSMFERQWVVRDFRKTAGMPVEEWLETLRQLEEDLQNGSVTTPPLERLTGYYEHLAHLAEGYEADPIALQDQLSHLNHWRDEVKALEALLDDIPTDSTLRP